MKRHTRAQRERRRGSTIVEFAFVFIAFLVTVVGLMEIGRAVWTYTTLSHAARRGARYAMIHGASNPVLDGNDDDITDAEIAGVVKAAAIGIDPASITVSAPTWTPDRTRGSTVSLTVTHTFNLVVGPPLLPKSTIPVSSTAQMIVAN